MTVSPSFTSRSECLELMLGSQSVEDVLTVGCEDTVTTSIQVWWASHQGVLYFRIVACPPTCTQRLPRFFPRDNPSALLSCSSFQSECLVI
eukprot:1754534-Pleurochrysis_carterae.AAC.1